jgi:hypothetical protein
MLEKIVLNNFKTFINETTIDFSATNYKFLENENVGSNRILKGALFVGENASGKTQILKAITFLLELLFSNNEIDFMYNKSFYTKKENYNLKYYFVVDNAKINYELEFAVDKITKEKLTYNDKIIINRIGNSAEFNYNEEKTFDNLSDKLLFLRRIYFDTHFYDDNMLNKWFDFLKNSIYINCYTRQIFYNNNSKLLVHDYLDDIGTDEINDFFKKIDYKQTIAYDSKTPNDNEVFNIKFNDNNKFVSFMKEGTDIYIPEIFESTGNNTLIQLLPVFLQAVKKDCMIILDEFSSGFHNELEECLIKYFNHYSKNSQMFFTSHSTNILNNTIIRPDQIYSVFFKGKKGSVLKRFSDEMPREAQNTEKMYLNGVFDGMPRYNKIFKD